MKSTDNLDNLRYIFNGQKADIATVKNAFKELFTNKADDLFKSAEQGGLGANKMKQLFESQSIQFNNASQFKNALNNQEFLDNVLKFIKSE